MDSSEFALSEEIIQSLSSGGDLDGVMSSEIFPRDSLYIENGDNEADDIIICHMDIREPLRQLQTILEDKLSISLDGYTFVLQETQELEPHKNLVDQCVKGKGLVQINVQIQTTAQRINIVDVLKPTENALAAMEENRGKWSLGDNEPDDLETEESDAEMAGSPIETSNDKHVLNWVLDLKFKKEQTRLNIPEDPHEWTIAQVRHWFQWAVRQFDLTDHKMSDWAITGQELCSLTHEEFCKKLPTDPGNVFWTHLQLLKECKFVSVVHESMEHDSGEQSSQNGDPPAEDHAIFRPKDAKRPAAATDSPAGVKEFKIMRKQISSGMDSPVHSVISTSHHHHSSNGGGSSAASNNNNNNNSTGGGGNASAAANTNGQCQLWQFLLEILTDREHVDIIQWVGNDGEFKLTDPESVARLWGIKKNKPAMNYEKLSRALRYYYDGDMISKVSGKRFAYKFDCDLKLLIGYDAAELSRLVNKKTLTQKSAYQEHLNMKSDDD